MNNDGVARSLSDFLASDADEERGFRPSSSTGVPRNQLGSVSSCVNFYKLANCDCQNSDSAFSSHHTKRGNTVIFTDTDLTADKFLQNFENGELVQQHSTNYDAQNRTVGKLAFKNSLELSANQPENNRSGVSNYKRQTAANQDEPCGLGWQSTKSTVRERMAHMYLNTHLSDVLFVVYENDVKQVFPAHKFALSIGSAVFDAMFKFDAAGHQEILLTDIEPKALTSLLMFLYKDEVAFSADSVISTLYAAKKYGVPALEMECVNFLKEHLSADNAFMLLAQSRLFDEPNLMENCLEIIDRDTCEALRAEGFLEIDHDTLCAVLQRDTLRVNELPLFHAVVKWSVEECRRKRLSVTPKNQRKVLGNALRLIRYTQMSVNEFAENVATSKLLTDQELVSIFLHFTMNTPPPIEFPIAQRRRFVGKQMYVNRFQRVEASWGYSGTPDRIKFTVDAAIWVLGFGLYGSMNDHGSYDVTLEIINFGSDQILAHHDTSFQSDGSPNIFPVMFKEPVEITPGVTYIAHARLMGVESHYGSKGLRRVVRQISVANGLNAAAATASSSSAEYGGIRSANNSITFQFSYAAGGNNGTSVDDGQIPQIIFCEKF